MENNFLYQIAKKVYENHKKELGDVCIVFPNKRAGLFFSHYLGEITDKPLWSPVFMTIRELMQELSGLELADPLNLVFKLYRIFKHVKKTEESFDEFYHWGEMLLNDFDEVDKYLVSGKEIFRNLSDLKEIDRQFINFDKEQLEVIKKFWKWFEPEKRSEHQEEFISLWEVLNKIYEEFKKEISSEGIAYEGMLYRMVAEKIINKQNPELKYSTYLIVGFNALSKSENLLFQYLKNSGKAEFYWDRDEYYVGKGKEFQEAGFFISKNLKDFPPAHLDLSFNSILTVNKNIEIIGVPSKTGQAKIIEQVFKESFRECEGIDYKTAVILPDENLLMPVVYSLPKEIENVNITMGYPVKNTPLFSLVCNLIELQRSTKIESAGKPVFYYKHILPVLQSHYIQEAADEDIKNIKQNIISGNIIYWHPGKDVKSELLKRIFAPVEKVEDLSSYLLEIIEYFHKQDTDNEKERNLLTTLDREYTFAVYTAIKRLDEIMKEARGMRLSFNIYYRLLNRYMHNIKIPFSGEPLSGLQIMGILETRTLDFDNVVILSMNEDVFPKSHPRYSFIPFNLRKAFGLPTIEHQDSIYAYYFYRLIQRARNISLIYNISQEGLKTGEMSRFLTQIKYDEEVHVTEKVLGYKINVDINEPIHIFKTEKVLKVLSEYIVRNNNVKNCFSPTALNIYLDCSLKFYFKYIARLKEADEIIEEIDPLIFGNLLHHTANLLYKPYKDKIVDLYVIDELLKDHKKIEDYVTKSFKKIPVKNPVIPYVLLNYVIKMLNIDKNYTPFRIIDLEKFHWLDIQVSLNNTPEKVRLGGDIDRIDKVDKMLRVIDYKTGLTENNIKSIDHLFAAGSGKREKAVLQTFIYALMLKQKEGEVPVIPGIYSLRDFYDEKFDYRIFIKNNSKSIIPILDISDYEINLMESLKKVIEEIYDTSIPFTQVNKDEICKNCQYKKLCGKDK